MNKLTTIGLFISCIFVAGCGGSDEEAASEERSGARMSVDAARKSADALRNSVESMPKPDIDLGGQLEILAPGPYAFNKRNADLRCQDEFPGSPFHAIWTVADLKTGIKVSGFSDPADGSMRKISTYNISTAVGPGETTPHLSSATLSTTKIGAYGAVTYYEVEATGTFEDGGTFKASGTCQA